MMEFIAGFVFAFLATLGFCILFHVPARKIPPASAVGGIGWLLYLICLSFDMSTTSSCFIAACAVGLLSDIASRVFKDAATLFVLPGILCLVPGAGMYNTMLAVINGDLKEAASICITTLSMAGAIALGLLVVGSFLRIIVAIVKKAENISIKL